jgi:ADP-ribose pyrophosphatase
LFEAKDKPVIVFPLTENKEVVAVKHFRYGANCVVLEVPGGNVEGKMTRKETAKKELLQETGYTSDNIIPVGPETWFDPASFRVHFFPMLASNCRKVSEPRPEKTEYLEPPY